MDSCNGCDECNKLFPVDDIIRDNTEPIYDDEGNKIDTERFGRTLEQMNRPTIEDRREWRRSKRSERRKKCRER